MQKIRLGMVGGGGDAFIGNIHRFASALDAKFELTCGAFSQTPEKSLQSGRDLNIASDRSYSSYAEMFTQEAKRPAQERMQAVSIVTPNKSHFDIATMALSHGFHVFCEKPVTFSLEESEQLSDQVKETGLQFALAHTYCGYPMVIEAKEIVREGKIGNVTKVVVDYSQGWLTPAFLPESQKQATWRLDATQAGISCCMGDIGVHAANLAEFICSDTISSLLADLGMVGDNRELDDDGSVFFRFKSGARGLLNASQISVGEENNLSIRIYGETGSIKWYQESPNELYVCINNEPFQKVTTRSESISLPARNLSRTPAGHPQGYIEAFANLYYQFAQKIINNDVENHLPGIDEGVSGMEFIDACVISHSMNNKWVELSNLQRRNNK